MIEFGVLRARIDAVLKGLSSCIESGGGANQGMVGELDLAKLCVDVGLALPSLDPDRQSTLCRMIDQIKNAITCIETFNFRREHSRG